MNYHEEMTICFVYRFLSIPCFAQTFNSNCAYCYIDDNKSMHTVYYTL